MTTVVRFKQDVYIGPDGVPTKDGSGVKHFTNGHEQIIVQTLRDLFDKHDIKYDVLLEGSEEDFNKKLSQALFD